MCMLLYIVSVLCTYGCHNVFSFTTINHWSMLQELKHQLTVEDSRHDMVVTEGNALLAMCRPGAAEAVELAKTIQSVRQHYRSVVDLLSRKMNMLKGNNRVEPVQIREV